MQILRPILWSIGATSLLALLLMGGQHAGAQTATVINLSCDGNVKIGSGDAEHVPKLGLVVNLPQHTVTGFVPIAHIDRLDDVNVDFSGQTTTQFGGSSSILGSIDRVTGSAWVNTTLTAKDGKILETQSYDLVCKVTNRLF
jgi:hypothetical protein